MEIVNNIPSADSELLSVIGVSLLDALPGDPLIDTLTVDGLTKNTSLQSRNFRFTYNDTSFIVLNISDIPAFLVILFETSPEAFLRQLSPNQLDSIIDTDKVVTLIEAHAFDVFDDTEDSSKILFEVNTAIDFFKHHGFSTYASQMLNYPSEEIVNAVLEHNLINHSELTGLSKKIEGAFFKDFKPVNGVPEYFYFPDNGLYNI